MGNTSAYSANLPPNALRFLEKFNDIRSYPGKKLVTILMVEGPTDRRLYERFVDEAKCHIEDIGNRETVIQVLSLLEQRTFSGVLSIVDADYDVLMNKNPTSPNLMFTDTHDIETMIIKSSAFERVLDSFCTEDKIERLKTRSGRDDIRTTIIECVKPIGYLRLISKRDGLDLKFSDIKFHNFTNADDLTLNVEALIEVVAMNGNEGTDKLQSLNITREEIRNRIEQLELSNLDYWHVCQGHDLTEILSIAFHKHIALSKTKNLTRESIEKVLVFAFDLPHFLKTDLYKLIKKWENMNKPYIVLKVYT